MVPLSPAHSTSASPLPTIPPTFAPGDFVAELAQSIPPQRDDLRLAIAFRGLSEDNLTDPPLSGEPLFIGAQRTFTIPNVVDNTNSTIDAELLAISEHAYFWFDKGPGSVSPNANQLDPVVEAFDRDLYLGC